MSVIPPSLAAEMATNVYQVLETGSRGRVRFPQSPQLQKHFDFDLGSGAVKGETGGVFGLFERESGFAVVGKGKARFNGHHVVAVRGSSIHHDWLTNGNFGVATGYNNTSVHTGFNKTFSSLRPELERRLSDTATRHGKQQIHVVGHSLGGAIASLVADWAKMHFNTTVNLYTFGAPRVGLSGYAQKSTFAIDQHFRCTHGADPVPMAPVWPFVHAPTETPHEYRLDSGQGFNPDAHKMDRTGSPGYVDTATGDDWGALQKRSTHHLKQSVRLKYKDRMQASFTEYWAERLSSALVTLLKDAGYYTIVMAQAAAGTQLTFYDRLARSVEKIAQISTNFAEQTAGLLGHMLTFAGKVAVQVKELTHQFIRWVFDKTLGALNRSVKQALNSL